MSTSQIHYVLCDIYHINNDFAPFWENNWPETNLELKNY